MMRLEWRAPALAAGAAMLSVLAGGTWWLALPAALLALLPGRAAPAGAAALILASLPAGLGWAVTALAFASGTLATLAALVRLGPGLPWAGTVAGAALLLALGAAWALLPHQDIWTHGDVAVRLRLLTLALAAALLAAIPLPRRRPRAEV